MSVNMKAYFFVPVLAICFFTACEDQEIGNSKDVNTDAVFQSYNIDFNEGDSAVEVVVQFRFGGEHGTTLFLDSGSNVALDGKQLSVDSGKVTGAFYKANLPVPSAESKHVLTFKGNNGKIYNNTFAIKPLVLLNSFKKPLARGELLLNFGGSNDNVPIQIEINDTLNAALACDTTLAIKNGQVLLPANFMGRLISGPISIHILQKQILPLQEVTKEGGQMKMTYQLKQIEAKLEGL